MIFAAVIFIFADRWNVFVASDLMDE